MKNTIDSLERWSSTLESLSSDVKKALNDIKSTHNNTITQTEHLCEKKNTLRNELEAKNSKTLELKQSIEKLQQETQGQLTSINKQIESKKLAINALQVEKKEINKRAENHRIRLDSLQEDFSFAQKEVREAEEQLRQLQEQLSELGSDKGQIDAALLLKFFRTLIERVFEGETNAKILLRLHSLESMAQKRSGLSNELGIASVMIRHWVYELVKADLVTFNEETEMVTLKKRLY